MTKAVGFLLVCTVVTATQESLPHDTATGWAGVDPKHSAGHVQGISSIRPTSPSLAITSGTVSIGGGAVGPSLTYTCDPSINTVAGACNALNTTIAALYTSKFSDINASIYVTFGATGLGQSQYVINSKTYASFRSALQADQTDSDDVIAFADSVPATNPVNTSDTVFLTNANARALGFAAGSGLQSDGSTFCTIGAAGCYDGIITVSSAQQSAGDLYFRTGPPITGSQYDFYSVVEHETDEILGTASCSIPACGSEVYPSDLYRYQSNGTRSFGAGNNNSCASSNSGNACFSIDGVHMLQQYNNLNNGEDSGDWATNCSQPLVQDAAACPGVGGTDISPTAELLVLDVIGYSVIAPPPLLVPNVVGMTRASATTAITGQGLVVGTITTVSSLSQPAGDVISESPVAGTQVTAGSIVSLIISGSQPLTVTPSSGSSGRQLFSFVTRDANGASSIQYVQSLFSQSGISASNACYFSYDPAANVFYLLSDDMTQWYGLAGGTSGTIGNAQCTIYGGTSGSTKAGTDLTTNVDISFRSGFAGLKTIYQFSGDALGDVSGWISMGTWNDVGDPNVVELKSLSPNSGTGFSHVFTAVVKDGEGASNIAFAQFLMNTALGGFNGCFIHYDRASNVFYLLNDSGTAFFGLLAGSATQVSNSQCTLQGVGSGGTATGPNLTVTYTLEFTVGFASTKQIYMQAVDSAGVIEVWHHMGTWTP